VKLENAGFYFFFTGMLIGFIAGILFMSAFAR
jgi:hypothetical protein